MAKGKIDMSKLTLGKAKPIKKKVTTVAEETTPVEEIAVQKIHEKESARAKKVASKPAPKEKIVRITVDVNKTMHKAIKMKAMNEEVTIREYIIQLVEKDFSWSGFLLFE